MGDYLMAGAKQGRWAKLNAYVKGVDPDDPRQLADAIARVYEAIAETPGQILQDFIWIPEAELMTGATARAACVARNDIEIAIGAQEIATVLDAARLLRALEANMLEAPAESVE